jgi:sugar phosphate isomerase/epimerase
MTPTIIGRGVVPFKDIFSFLNKKNFSGWYCIEEASNKGIIGVEEAVRFVKNMLRAF